MIKLTAGMLTLFAASTGLAQSPEPTSEVKYYRLTFVLNNASTRRLPQTIELDVPVAAGRPGMTGFNSAAGSTGDVEGSVTQSMEVTNVQKSATGLSARVSFSADTITKASNGEPLHTNRVFNKTIDVALAKPTEITDESKLVPLGEAAKASALLAPSLQITITAAEL